MSEHQEMPMLKVSVLHYRDPSRDEETWIKWYMEEHIPRFIPIVQRHGIHRCELYITPQSLKDKFQADLDELKGDGDERMASYDAVITYWVTDPQQMRNMLTDPDWTDKVAAFEVGWIDLSKMDMQIGTQTTFIEGGAIVNTITKEYD
ncbi:hypothetical protein B0I35DRAFT_513942 [Stachybotrys elegans]|uniref:EthD domain-containing protein n=1 Tax=Stachybotrys elegans TaxID=80388 RepID=A0A8K0WQH0_9HYPO|nr:hypothetical protein B0I35DRAFT_513942 [Stachybotrys elegans]